MLVSQARMFIRNALACMTAWIRKYRNQRDYFHESARAQKKATTPINVISRSEGDCNELHLPLLRT